ncbi:transporter substrate-binding domain-containing protein [Paraburkholderia xenovorans]|jgi:polar amino acid transport system substrate-binding protein|uniref:transporter substrate-binding domain-containing protein n=1 Tax=Paraburkholderia xenovorans TaxID=36873 RepID=UPI0038BA5A19
MTKLSKAIAARRRALAATLLPLVAWATIGIAHAASLEEIKKRGYIVVATEDDYRPFEFVKDGKPTGFDNEMVDALQKYAPFEVRHEILPFTGILAGVATGKYDIAITGATMSKDRMQSLDFASPIADATDYYVKRKNDDSIKSIKDLSGKAVGVQAGSAQLAHLSQLQAQIEKSGGKMGKIVQYASYPEAYQDLALGRTDYVVNTIINLTTLVNQKPGVFALGQPVAAPSMAAWSVQKGNADLLAYINQFIAKEKANGTVATLQKKWFGQSFNLPVTFTPEY